jgi:hypothetical protein
MTRLMRAASVLCFAIPCSAMAAGSTHTSVPSATLRHGKAQPAKIVVPAPLIDPRALTTMHFSISGHTATWGFAFSCNGAHCTFKNSHHPRDPQDPGYVAIDTVFDDDPA